MRREEKYIFKKDIRILDTKDKIPIIFDALPKKKSEENHHTYQGTINNIEVRVYFRHTHPCKLTAKTQEDLNKAYNGALNRLLSK